jgi:hypothetical protein
MSEKRIQTVWFYRTEIRDTCPILAFVGEAVAFEVEELSSDMGEFFSTRELPKEPGLWVWEGVIRSEVQGVPWDCADTAIVWDGAFRRATADDARRNVPGLARLLTEAHQ